MIRAVTRRFRERRGLLAGCAGREQPRPMASVRFPAMPSRPARGPGCLALPARHGESPGCAQKTARSSRCRRKTAAVSLWMVCCASPSGKRGWVFVSHHRQRSARVPRTQQQPQREISGLLAPARQRHSLGGARLDAAEHHTLGVLRVQADLRLLATPRPVAQQRKQAQGSGSRL